MALAVAENEGKQLELIMGFEKSTFYSKNNIKKIYIIFCKGHLYVRNGIKNKNIHIEVSYIVLKQFKLTDLI